MKFHPVIRHVNFDPQKQKIGGTAIFFVSTDGRLHTRTQVVKPEMVELVEKYLRQKCNIGGHTGGLPILEDGEWEILIEEISKGFQYNKRKIKQKMLYEIQNLLNELKTVKWKIKSKI